MQVVVKTWAVADMRAVVMQRLHIGDERPLDLRPALVAFVVERPRHRQRLCGHHIAREEPGGAR